MPSANVRLEKNLPHFQFKLTVLFLKQLHRKLGWIKLIYGSIWYQKIKGITLAILLV